MAVVAISGRGLSPDRDWLAFGVALYGAMVATGVAAQQFIRERPGVKVIINPYGFGATKEPNAWGIRVVNHRKRPITIREVGLLGDRGQRLRLPFLDPDTGDLAASIPLPITITDGMSCQFFVPLDLVRDRDRAGAFAIDDLGHVFAVREPRFSLRRRWEERRARKEFERGLRSAIDRGEPRK